MKTGHDSTYVTNSNGAEILISSPFGFSRNPSSLMNARKLGEGAPQLRNSKGLKRRLSESARDLSGEGFCRLTRFGSGLKKKFSTSTRDLLTSHLTFEKTLIRGDAKEDIKSGASLLGIHKLEDNDREDVLFKEEEKENLRRSPFIEEKGLTKQISSSMRDLFLASKALQEKRKEPKKKLSRRLSFLTEVMLGKIEKSNYSNRFSRAKKVRNVEVQVLQPNGTRITVSTNQNI